MSVGRTSTFIDIYAERDLANGTYTEEQIQEFVDDYILKLRVARHLRTSEYNELFGGDPMWITEGIAGVGMALIATSDLLTLKKTIYVANLAENEVNDPESSRHYLAVKQLADAEGSQIIPICAKLEADIAELDDPDEKAMFMEELGVKESGLDRLIRSSYTLLGLISFLTAGSDECRAWTIKKGTKAPQAAGKIHTDFERGFIRAEVIAFEDMKACGTMAAAKAKGLVRSEGKDYVMKDGDIVNFLFNV